MDIAPSKSMKEFQSFPGTINYLSKFSPSAMDVCELLRKLTPVKSEWKWNGTYHDLYEKAKMLITKDVHMKFQEASKPLYLKMDASGIGLDTGLQQMQDGMNSRHEQISKQCSHLPNSIHQQMSVQCKAVI